MNCFSQSFAIASAYSSAILLTIILPSMGCPFFLVSNYRAPYNLFPASSPTSKYFLVPIFHFLSPTVASISPGSYIRITLWCFRPVSKHLHPFPIFLTSIKYFSFTEHSESEKHYFFSSPKKHKENSGHKQTVVRNAGKMFKRFHYFSFTFFISRFGWCCSRFLNHYISDVDVNDGEDML